MINLKIFMDEGGTYIKLLNIYIYVNLLNL